MKNRESPNNIQDVRTQFLTRGGNYQGWHDKVNYTGGGGAGTASDTSGTNATASTGGGGGGAGNSNSGTRQGGNGGSGIVIVRYAK